MRREKINVFIIDDEETHLIALTELLRICFSHIKVIGTANSVESGIELLKGEIKPDIVFLDVNLTDGTGFDILQSVDYSNFEIIFVTSHNEYAVNAFEFAALHYIIKPVTEDKIADAIDRFDKNKHKDNYEHKLKILNENLLESPENIIIPTTAGFSMIRIADILRLESENSYTIVHLFNNHSIISSKNLRRYESLLNPLGFMRIHQSHLVNLKFVKKFIKGRSPIIEMSDSIELPLSPTKRDEFLERLNDIACTI